MDQILASERWEPEKFRRVRTRLRVMHGLCRIAFVMLCIAVGFVVVATAFPQQRELRRLQEKLKSTLAREHVVQTESLNRRIELQALREDPAYLEVQARDRLDYSREGERVLRIGVDR